MVRLVPALIAAVRFPELARPRLIVLASELRETVNLAILQGAEIVYVLSESADRLLTPHARSACDCPPTAPRWASAFWRSCPQMSPASRLATSRTSGAPSGRSRPGRRSPRTCPRSARQGVSISEEEYEVGLVSVAVPVRWLHGPGTGAINVSLPAGRASAEFRDRLTQRFSGPQVS